jgi:hypothetical protein
MLMNYFLLSLTMSCASDEDLESQQQVVPEQKNIVEQNTRKEQIEEQNQVLFEMDQRRDQRKPSGIPNPPEKPEIFEILLVDGSVIKGEVFDIENGNYKIKNQSMGEISVNASNVVRIQKIDLDKPSNNEPNTPTPAPSEVTENQTVKPESKINENNLNLAQIELVKSSLTSDPGTILQLSQLRSNSTMMSVLQDPELMNLIKDGDLTALEQHPKIQQLMKDPSIVNLLGNVQP